MELLGNIFNKKYIFTEIFMEKIIFSNDLIIPQIKSSNDIPRRNNKLKWPLTRWRKPALSNLWEHFRGSLLPWCENGNSCQGIWTSRPEKFLPRIILENKRPESYIARRIFTRRRPVERSLIKFCLFCFYLSIFLLFVMRHGGQFPRVFLTNWADDGGWFNNKSLILIVFLQIGSNSVFGEAANYFFGCCWENLAAKVLSQARTMAFQEQ